MMTWPFSRPRAAGRRHYAISIYRRDDAAHGLDERKYVYFDAGDCKRQATGDKYLSSQYEQTIDEMSSADVIIRMIQHAFSKRVRPTSRDAMLITCRKSPSTTDDSFTPRDAKARPNDAINYESPRTTCAKVTMPATPPAKNEAMISRQHAERTMTSFDQRPPPF